MAERARFHHGDLAGALVREGVGLLAEVGLRGFSVATLARRLGVSTAAPYRHFADRDRLLAAVVTLAAGELADAMEAAAGRAGDDPVARLALAGGAYARFLADRRVGLDLVYGAELRALGDRELAAVGRRIVDVLLGPALELTDPAAAVPLMERVVAVAHGYGALDADGFLAGARVGGGGTSERAEATVAAVVRGTAGTSPSPASGP